MNYYWEWLLALHGFLNGELGNLERCNFGRFPYLAQIDREIMPQFVTILKSVILNLSVRFFCIGFSLNKKTIRRFLNYENMTIDPMAPVVNSSRCGLSPLLEVFNLRHTDVTTHMSLTLPQLHIEGDWDTLARLLPTYRDLVLGRTERRSQLYSERENKLRDLLELPTTSNLVDVFGVVPKESLPRLWRFVVRIHTIMPTTVACEQCFDSFKRTNHINISDQTAMVFLFARLYLYENSYNL